LFNFLSYCLVDLVSTTGAKDMPFAQDRAAARAFRLYAFFEMHNGQRSVGKINVSFLNADSFSNSYSAPSKDCSECLISRIASCLD
jgi:hypothetical protein